MLGAIAGDIAGSMYEWGPVRGDKKSFPLFGKFSRPTDDSVMTLAIGDAMRNGYGNKAATEKLVRESMLRFGHMYPNAGYGGNFTRWLETNGQSSSYSFGNGSAMRVSSVGWVCQSLEETEEYATISARVTHGQPEGIKGACAVATAIYLARNGSSKEDIKTHVGSRYGYDMGRTLAQIKPGYSFDVTCQGSVPEAITAFLESTDTEDAIRLAIWLGGDSDTQAAIAGSIAEAFYGPLPKAMEEEVMKRLDGTQKACLRAWQTWLLERNGK